MKIKSYIFLSLAASGLPSAVQAADIVNGWSAQTTISKMHSEYSRTLFKLSDTSVSCGHPDMWSLPLDNTAVQKAKLSMLLAAFAAGKMVSLRCESSTVTDFEILN